MNNVKFLFEVFITMLFLSILFNILFFISGGEL